MLLDNLALFLRIVEKGGIAAGGREMGLSPATVSERLAALENHYGARLLNRTTRSISLTEEGRELIAGAQRLLAEAEELEARTSHLKVEVARDREGRVAQRLCLQPAAVGAPQEPVVVVNGGGKRLVS